MVEFYTEQFFFYLYIQHMLDLKIYFYTQHIVYEFQTSGFCLTKQAYQYIQCMYMYQVYLKHVYKKHV